MRGQEGAPRRPTVTRVPDFSQLGFRKTARWPGSGRFRVPGLRSGSVGEARGILGWWLAGSPRCAWPLVHGAVPPHGLLAGWRVRSSGPGRNPLSQYRASLPCFRRARLRHRVRPAAAPDCGRDLEDARALLPPSRGPQRASRRAWGAPDVSVLFYSYSPAGASHLGAVFSGTNSPSAPARRRARGWKGEWPEPGRGRRSCLPAPSALCGGAKAGSGAGSPEVGRFHHEVGGASVFSPGSPKRQRPSSLGPDPVSSPSVALLGGGGCGNRR